MEIYKFLKSLFFISRSRAFRLLSLFILLGLTPSMNEVFAGFNRTMGLVNIPTGANFLKEGEFEEGASVLFSSDTLSLNVRFNYAINDKSEIGISILNENTARLNFHWRALGMQKMLIGMGIQNIPLGGTNTTSSFSLSPYVVVSLYFPQVDMYFHIGQGGGRFLNESGQSAAFNGLFFGLEKTIKALKLLADFDGNYLNLGIRYSLSPTIIIEGAAIKLNDTRNGLAACIGASFIQPPARKSIMEVEKKSEIPSASINETGSLLKGITGIGNETKITLDNLALEHAQTGTRYYYQGEYEKAVDSFKMAISLNPNFALFHSQIGSVYYKLKMLDSALAEWEKAYELNPDNQLKDFIENFKKIKQR